MYNKYYVYMYKQNKYTYNYVLLGLLLGHARTFLWDKVYLGNPVNLCYLLP